MEINMRIGMLTSGGDCQALNAAMRGVAKSLYNKVDDVQIYGFLDGYRGLINNTYKLMDINDFSGILTIGGTILGTSRTPFKKINEPDENGVKVMMKLLSNRHKMYAVSTHWNSFSTKTVNHVKYNTVYCF